MAKNFPARLRCGPAHPHRVVMLMYPDAQILDITGPLEVFARTSRWLADHRNLGYRAYDIELVAPAPGPVVTSSGLSLIAGASFQQAKPAGTLLVAGGVGYVQAMRDTAMIEWIRSQARHARRVASICTGAMLLAAAGLLEGKRATTHWAYCSRLAAMDRAIRVEPDSLYVRSGRFYTSAGVTAGMDLTLALVEEDWGKAVSLAVAQELVMYLRRPGGQSQFSRFLEAEARDDRFGRLQLWMLRHLEQTLSVEQLASRCNLSERQLAREFLTHTGMSPAAYVTRVRVEEARRRIESGAGQLKEVARRCGFGTEQRLRRAFSRLLGITPQEYRQRFGA